ncbi:CpaF family protein [Candidatus Woesearchaeota archaeon]|nr:CpaF family protein [Candidatus Woesearchaeota archaeon]
MIKEKYDFYSGNIPVNVTIESQKDEFVLIYNVTVSQISSNTELVLDKIRDELIDKVKLSVAEITDPKKTEYVKDKFRESIVFLTRKYFPEISEETRDFFTTYLMHKSFGLGRIELLLNDSNLEEVVVNNADESIWVYHHKHGWLKTNIILKDEELVKHYSNLIGRKVNRSITTLTPLLDAHLDTGDRVNATLFPITTKGNTITIRKFSEKPITITTMLKDKSISLNAAALLWLGIQYELSMLVSGGTASGKSTVLSALCNFFPPNQRIITIEDTREISLAKYLHWVPMVTREPNVEGKGEVSMLDLIVNSLRMRPDRIVVGEVRRKREAEVLFEAMHTGHSVYATLHANDSKEVIDRLTNPPIDVPKTLLPSISLLVIMYRNRRTGIRRVYQVSEVLRDSTPNVLMQYDARQDKLLNAGSSSRVFPELEMQTGLTAEQLNNDLKEKAEILKWLVRKNIDDMNGIGKVVATYYTNREGLLNFIKRG